MKYCEEYAALLDLYVDGELPAEEMLRVQEHLEACPGCRAYVDDALAIRAAFPEAEETEVPEGFREGVMARVREASSGQTGKKVISFRRWARVLAPLAACCALVLVLRSVPGAGGGMDGSKTAESGGAMMDAPAPASAGGAALPAGEEAEDAANDAANEACAPMEDAYAADRDEAGAGQAPRAAAEPRMSRTGGSAEEAAEASAEEPSAAEPSAKEPFSEERGTAGGTTAPVLMMPAAAPTAPESAPEVQERETDLDKITGNDMGKCEAALSLTEEEAGGLLDGYAVLEEAAGVRRYELTPEEYAALLAALGLEGGAERKEDAPEPVIVEVRTEP